MLLNMSQSDLISVSISDELFDGCRLDILNKVRDHMVAQKLTKSVDIYLKKLFRNEIDMTMLLSEVHIDDKGFKPYFTFDFDERWYSIYLIMFGDLCCVQVNDFSRPANKRRRVKF